LTMGTLLAGNVYAQDETQRPNRGNRQRGGAQAGGRQGVAQAFKAVAPTADQEAKFKTLQEAVQKDMAALREIPREERREKSQAVNAKFQTDTIALLTEEQKVKFQEELRKTQQRRGGLMNALEPLKLTDDQKKSVEPIIQDTQRAMMETMRNQDIPQQERMAKVTGLLDEFKGKVRPLLTADQQKKFDALDFRRAMAGGRAGRGIRQRGADAPPPSVR
jgi:hypothetical protein